MQFYKNGFRGGNPGREGSRTQPAQPRHQRAAAREGGCADRRHRARPACAWPRSWRSSRKIETMIVERMPTNIIKGKADGINTRTMEMFQAFGFADKVKRETYWVNQTNFWMPDPANPAHIKRVGRVQDVADDSSEMPHILINQARLHELFLEVMRNSPSRLEPDYSWEVVSLTVDPTTDDHPVTVTLKDASGVNWWATRTVRANYVVGCDGAHSAVRKSIGGVLHGDAAHQAWGVMDILANTDFPDVRQKCLISLGQRGQRADPAARGRLRVPHVRGARQAGPRREGRQRQVHPGRHDRRGQPHPPALHHRREGGRLVVDLRHRPQHHRQVRRRAEGSDRNPRVFTAGDACHTHSPRPARA
jgi:phenol 2-monooxygenase